MCHHKSLNFVHTWKHIFTWEGVRLIWVWLNSPVYFIVSYKWNKVLEDQVTVWALHRELVDVSTMYLQRLSIEKLWTTRATLKSTFLWTHTSLHGININTALLPAGVQEGGGGETHWAPGLLPQAVRCCWGWVHFLVRFSNMDLQAIFVYCRSWGTSTSAPQRGRGFFCYGVLLVKKTKRGSTWRAETWDKIIINYMSYTYLKAPAELFHIMLPNLEVGARRAPRLLVYVYVEIF